MSFGNRLGIKLVQEEFLIEKKMDVKGRIIIEEEYQERVMCQALSQVLDQHGLLNHHALPHVFIRRHLSTCCVPGTVHTMVSGRNRFCSPRA